MTGSLFSSNGPVLEHRCRQLCRLHSLVWLLIRVVQLCSCSSDKESDIVLLLLFKFIAVSLVTHTYNSILKLFLKFNNSYKLIDAMETLFPIKIILFNPQEWAGWVLLV